MEYAGVGHINGWEVHLIAPGGGGWSTEYYRVDLARASEEKSLYK